MTIGIIFDFDDTLIETTKHFNQAKEVFRRLMGELDFPEEECLDTLNQFDINNVRQKGGFLKECFPMALGETYDYYCQTFERKTCSKLRGKIVDSGWQVFNQEVEEIEGAREVLESLSRKYPLFLATKGEPELQMTKLKTSGLDRYFNKVYITPDKTVREYKVIATEQNLKVSDSWIIGNSMKGDINPGLELGFKCIHVFHPHTWDYEEETPVGVHFSVKSIREVLDVIL